MRVDHSASGVEPRIGYSQHADATVVVWHMLYKPIDRVVSISRLVGVFGYVMFFQNRPHMHELAFRRVAPANILQREDEPLLGVVVKRTTRSRIHIFAIW